MWLADFVTNNRKTSKSSEQAIVKNSNKGLVQVKGTRDYRQLSVIAPYGISYLPPIDENIVVIHTDSNDVCAGVVSGENQLEPGELMLCSKGGASIVLKNDGGVYINGKKY